METDAHPNVLLLMDDQHRFDWLGCAGHPAVRTPNLDRLAARGMRLTQCYTNAPLCNPARKALATGQLPHRMDFGGWLPLRIPTYYQRLRNRGYHVGYVGKTDLAKGVDMGRHGDPPVAYAWGFTHPCECEGKMGAGKRRPEPQGPYTWHLWERGLLERFQEDYATRARTSHATDNHDSVLPADAVEDAYIGRHAVEWIAQHLGDFPWHLFVSFVGPHDPFDPPTEYAQRYRDVAMPEPIPSAEEDEHKPERVREKAAGFAQAGRTPAQIAEARRQYSAAVEQIDDEIGRILDALEARGELEQTYILFTSDHGEMLGDHGLYRKHEAYEASARVPLIAAGPGIPEEVTSDALVELIDLNPTICQLAGIEPEPDIDARSFAPLLRGETNEHRDAVVGELADFSFLYDGRYKAVFQQNDRNELYDLDKDPDERRNLAEEEPERLSAMWPKLMQGRMQEGGWNR